MGIALSGRRAREADVEGKAVTGIAQHEQGLSFCRPARAFVLADVAWRGCERDAQRPAVALGTRKLAIGSLDRDILIGPQAGYLKSEYVGRFPRGKSRLLASSLGALILCFGLLPLSELRLNLHIAEAHLDPRHRCVAGKGKAVARLQYLIGLFTGVAISLDQPKGCQRSDNLSPQLRAAQRHKPARGSFSRLPVHCDLEHRNPVGPRVLECRTVKHGSSSSHSRRVMAHCAAFAG